MKALSLLGLSAALLGSAAACQAAETGLPVKPNVLLIAVDDLRDWVHYLGANPQVQTPNFDRLAARGLHFTRSYCAAPLCNPSRTALLSGLRPGATGVYHNYVDWRKIVPADDPTLPLWFKTHGYYAAGAGKIYHSRYRRDSDWNDYLASSDADEDDAIDKDQKKAQREQRDAAPRPIRVGKLEYGPIAGGDDALEDYHSVSYIVQKLQEPHEQPFFLACGLKKPHLPWTVPKKYFDLYPLDSIQLPKILETDLDDVPAAGVKFAKPKEHREIVDAGKWKEAVQAYLATISYSDAMLGRLLEGFDRSGHAADTIVCCWSDHGWHLGEKLHWHKSTLWEEAGRAPLIFVVPGLTRPGSVCARPVDHMCIYPTLAELCGLDVPGHVQGASIRRLLSDPEAAWERPAVTTHQCGNHSVRSERWRYIRYADGSEEMYDHDADPLEWTNLAGEAQYASAKADLARWLPTQNVDLPAPDEEAQKAKEEKHERQKKKRHTGP